MTNTSAERAAVSRIRAENRAANAAVRATNTSSAPSSSSGSSSSSSSGGLSSRILTEEENIAMIKAPAGTIVDVGAAERFDVIVSVVEADGKVESSSKKRKIELEEIISQLVPEENAAEQ